MPTLESAEPFAESSGRSSTAAPRVFGSTLREMPILFRMTDVAQEKRKVVAAPANDPVPSRAAALEAAKLEAARLEGVKKSLAQTEHLATKANASTNHAADRGRATAATVAAALPAKELVSESAAVISRAEISARPEPTKADVTNTTPPTAASAPTPRQRAELRERRAQEAATAKTVVKSSPKSNWFGSHGKVIAIGFVICLVGTVCLARINRQNKSGSGLESTAGVPVIQPKSADPAETHGIAPSSATAPTEHGPATAATRTTVPGPDFTKPTTEKTDESLFPWKGSDDARTATRPEAPRNPIPAYTPVESSSPATPDAEPKYQNTDERTFRTLDPNNPSNTLRPGETGSAPTNSSKSPASFRSPNPTSISGIRHER